MKDTYLHYDEVYEDGSFKAETTMIMSPCLPEVRANQHCRNAVSYEDGSRARDFYYRDYNAMGEAVIVFFHPLSLAHSVCHFTDMYQGSQFIGRDY